ncbi:MAG: nucleotidyltransferase domain-containing protein [Trueperaceae bacterium]|nr:nucleotidyltransferase domain-containing protein [Trueperaceae bacterium]
MEQKTVETIIVQKVLEHLPRTQAVYLFGTYGTDHEWPHSDIDIAVLLPPRIAKTIDSRDLIAAQNVLELTLGKPVDLINLRRIDTVLQFEIVTTDRRIYTADAYAADEFEMLTLSFYQKLNEERAELLRDARRESRAYAAKYSEITTP